MDRKSEIRDCFKEFNIEVSDTILNRCAELCVTYNIESSEDFVDQWCAFTASNLSGQPPSLEYLDKLERNEFQKYRRVISTPKSSKKANLGGNLDCDLVSSGTTTPKSNRTLNNFHTPDQQSKNLADVILANDESPAYSYSSSQNHYTDRKDSRAVQCEFGGATADYKGDVNVKLSIEVVQEETNRDVKYMYEIMGAKARALSGVTEWLGQSILNKHNLIASDGMLRNTQGDLTTFGRIVSDSDGKINIQSVLLEGSQESQLGHTVSLNLSKLSSFSLFPGQVAVVKGMHSITSKTLIAERIITDGAPELPEEPPVTQNPLQIVIASGPFTLQANLAYEPLNDLLNYVVDHKPNLLLLLGPFLEASHDNIKDGSFTQPFDLFFESLVETVMTQLENTEVQVVIVASHKDLYHDPVYPTPACKIRKDYKNLMFVRDPCMIKVNGLVIGATTADVLVDLGNFEIYQDKNFSGQADRIGRLASHLLSQKSFYPVYPPSVDLPIDHEMLAQFGVFEFLPHILILPSNLRSFVKNIKKCLVVNPQRLTKANVAAGTFARLEITPGENRSVCGRTSCQVLKI